MPTATKDKKPTTKKTKKTTLINLILDRSGSMSACAPQVISGFNEYLLGLQKDDSDVCLFSMVQFDLPDAGVARFDRPARVDRQICETLYLAEPVKNVKPLTPDTYQPRGMTPLYDAIGMTITQVDKAGAKFDRCITVIMTDGQENSSKEWDKKRIGDLITAKEALGNWTFVFLGADQNAWGEASKFAAAGTTLVSNSISYHSRATAVAFASVGQATAAYRAEDAVKTNAFFGQAATGDATLPTAAPDKKAKDHTTKP